MLVVTLSADQRALYMNARRSPLKLPAAKPQDIETNWEAAAARAEDIVLRRRRPRHSTETIQMARASGTLREAVALDSGFAKWALTFESPPPPGSGRTA